MRHGLVQGRRVEPTRQGPVAGQAVVETLAKLLLIQIGRVMRGLAGGRSRANCRLTGKEDHEPTCRTNAILTQLRITMRAASRFVYSSIIPFASSIVISLLGTTMSDVAMSESANFSPEETIKL